MTYQEASELLDDLRRIVNKLNRQVKGRLKTESTEKQINSWISDELEKARRGLNYASQSCGWDETE